MDIENFLSHFSHVRKNSNGWQAKCPAHEDKKASLSIAVKDGKILLHCHAGCPTEAILEALHLKPKDLFLEPKAKANKPAIVATYDYTDETGKLLFQTIRFEPKDFRQRRPEGKGKWFWNLSGVRLVPYRLPELLKVSSIFVVEGEKDADNLWKIGIPATCNPMGAGKWHAEWSQLFEGKEITILPDLDEPGRKHALDVGKKLFGHALKIKIVELPKKAHVKDISDWLSHGGTKAELLKLAKEATAWHPTSSSVPMQPKNVLKTTSAHDLMAMEFPEPRWAVPGLISEGYVILAGRPKRGKSWFALGLAIAIASGGYALGKIKVEQGEVLYLALEDNMRRLQNRIKTISNENSPIPKKLHLVTDIKPLREGGAEAIKEWLKEYPNTRLLIIDTISHPKVTPPKTKGGDAYQEDYRFGSWLQKIARDHNICIFGLMHTKKSEADYAVDKILGSTGITAPADEIMVIDTAAKGRASAILHVTGRDVQNQELALHFENGIWSVLGEAEEYIITDQRKAVLDILRTHGPMWPKEIANKTGLNLTSTYKLLERMRQSSLITQVGGGRSKYTIQEQNIPTFPDKNNNNSLKE
jgi:5S rRNA maturation endonuclease (ribonuclease M5)